MKLLSLLLLFLTSMPSLVLTINPEHNGFFKGLFDLGNEQKHEPGDKLASLRERKTLTYREN